MSSSSTAWFVAGLLLGFVLRGRLAYFLWKRRNRVRPATTLPLSEWRRRNQGQFSFLRASLATKDQPPEDPE